MKFDVKIGPSVFMVQSDESPDDLFEMRGGVKTRDGFILGQYRYIKPWVVHCQDWENMFNMFSFNEEPIKRSIVISNGEKIWYAEGCFVSEYVYTTKSLFILIDWIG
ncbi:hypothetical protein P19_0190 [Aeromonas phage P19]|uniref:Uncharacterized protein n=3 Tax=Caudoviricetes TaxID=2731619 RepID=A0A291LE49_9CAUD|nr:hypothetical protein [Aeromonas phage AS-szw]QAX98051.1 hypothetical protein ASswx1_411 [Aeromonas phage Asswx_1]QAX98908.1 hypothetical protein assk_112 [Aeromonas phage Assk]QMV28816.1 hypothetical protein AP1_0109 [Aeromonas phage AP1]UKM62678.1 hypothetical protein P19_0190 [Aeromonas phage P19]